MSKHNFGVIMHGADTVHNFGKIKNIFCGASHNIILNNNNELYVCGYNCSGQLGLGNTKTQNTYVKLEHDCGKIKNIFCGAYHNIILNDKNELYVCGWNYYGQLGLGNNKKYRDTYIKLEHDCGKIKTIYCGANHNIILNEQNELYVCGWNCYGQLGLDDNKDRDTYVKLKHNYGVIKTIYCGACHNIILNNKNELYVCGGNEYGQLGLGNNKQQHTYIKLEHNFGKIKTICCGLFHNIILNNKNELYVCGYNECGQLGLGDDKQQNTFIKLEHNFNAIKTIYCGGYHNIILSEQNELYVCGWNKFGQLGLGDNINRYQYVKLEQDILERHYKITKLLLNTTNIIL